MIHVVAVITAKPGMRASILQAFHPNAAAVKAEPGWVEYGAFVDADNALAFQTKYGPDTFLAIEKWESMDAGKAHAATPHMVASAAATKGRIGTRLVHILSPA